MKHTLNIFLVLAIFVIGCKKATTSGPVEEQLPPETQKGKNTFGCILNGKVWAPYKTDFSRKLEVWYDPNYHLGTLRIIAERRKNGSDQRITIAMDSLNHIGHYSLTNSKGKIYYDDLIKNCIYDSYDTSVLKTGNLNITKLDFQNRIIAGTFDFKLIKAECDTIRATQGRFDVKF